MRIVLVVLLCLMLTSCATASKSKVTELEGQVLQLQDALSQKEADLQKLQDLLKERDIQIGEIDSQLSEKDKKIEEMRKRLEMFGVFEK